MKAKLSKWQWTKRILLVIFTIHFVAFLIFLIRKMSEADFAIEHLRAKVAVVLAFIIAISLIYYFGLRKKPFFKKTAIFLREAFFILYGLAIFYVVLGLFFNPPITLTQIGSFLQGYGLHRDYVSGNAIGKNGRLAVIAAEDQLFPDHDGFDIKAIKQAIKYNNKHVNKQRGASTISQQTAKNIFLWQGGGFFRKGLEVFFTFTIESVWPKQVILDRYVNIAEMGPGIFGIEAASQKFFNKSASQLSTTEAAAIAACLPNPKRFIANQPSKYISGRTNFIARQMNAISSDPDVTELIK